MSVSERYKEGIITQGEYWGELLNAKDAKVPDEKLLEQVDPKSNKLPKPDVAVSEGDLLEQAKKQNSMLPKPVAPFIRDDLWTEFFAVL